MTRTRPEQLAEEYADLVWPAVKESGFWVDQKHAYLAGFQAAIEDAARKIGARPPYGSGNMFLAQEIRDLLTRPAGEKEGK